MFAKKHPFQSLFLAIFRCGKARHVPCRGVPRPGMGMGWRSGGLGLNQAASMSSMKRFMRPSTIRLRSRMSYLPLRQPVWESS